MRLTTKKFEEVLENLNDNYKAVTVQFFVEQFWNDLSKDTDKIELFEALRQNILDRNEAINRTKPSLLDGKAKEEVEGFNKRIEKVRQRLRVRILRHLNKLDKKGVVNKRKDGRRNIYYLN